MNAQMTTTVRLATLIPGGEVIETAIGTLTVPVRDGAVALDDLHKALGGMLRKASDHLLSGAPDGFELAPPGVGESRS
ncbi:hypothetical protein ACIO3R_07285 [Streptomyces sp. NPDC087428]|uniref:hypothetical protein n=1 Tax=Streptomyces sp. NPDC087428 TaxID=3365788 RepID=UPI00380A7BFF